MWQLEFMANASILNDMQHNLRVDEGVLRWTVVKRRAIPKLPKLTQLFKVPELQQTLSRAPHVCT